MKIYISTFFSVLFLSLLFVFTTYAQTDNNSNKSAGNSNTQTQNKRIVIIKKPRTSSESSSKCFKEFGYSDLGIKLKVTFHISGKVTAVEIVKSSGCEYFDKESMKVAAKIKFEPEIKNGQPVTVALVVEYTARIY